MANLIDTRIDPGTLSPLPLELKEHHTVVEVAGLNARYGFSLGEIPEKPLLNPTITECYYLDDKGEQVDLRETSLSLFNLSENQFSCNYGSTGEEENRNFRLGQIFVHSSLLDKVIVIKYRGLGSIVNAYNLYNALMPVGYVYAQYPFCLPPSELYPLLKWQKVTALNSTLAGSFFRLEGGSAREFESGLQGSNGAGSHSHNVTYTIGNGGGLAQGHSSGNEGSEPVARQIFTNSQSNVGESYPSNFTFILWVRVD